MKKTLIAFVLMAMIPAPSARAFEIRLAFQTGPRAISDSEIKDVYGTGSCSVPSVSVAFWKGLFAGASLELAGERSGTIGEYAEATTFKMTGFQVYAGYELALGRLKPYALAGYGSYSYEQTVNSPAAQPVKETKGTIFYAGGVRIDVWKGLFVSAEGRYVPLKVQPYDIEVDLGGMRWLFGIGWAFGI